LLLHPPPSTLLPYTTLFRSPAGDFRVTVTADGFETAVRTGVHINVAETTRLNVELSVGGLTATVEVSAATEMAQTETSALGRVADRKSIRLNSSHQIISYAV